MATEIHSSGPSQDSNTPLTSTASNFTTPEKGEEDVGLSLSEGDDGDDEERKHDIDDKDEEDRRIENIGDENPHLMAYLDHSDSNNSNAIASSSEEESNDDDADLDDSRIEAAEEQAIRADYKQKNRSASIPGPVTLRRLSQSQQARTQNGRDSDDSESSDAISENSSWGNDFLEDYFDLPPNDQRVLNSRNAGNFHIKNEDGNGRQKHNDYNDKHQYDDDENHENESGVDDSYLWQYFFSSDENGNDNNDVFALSNPTSRARQRRISRSKRAHSQSNTANNEDDDGSTDDDLPLKGRGPLAPSQMAKVQPAGYIPSGDSTDEDDGVPPERKRRRARGAKAIEVLGSNSFSARPPILGSWRIKGDKNVGIIDGLTTRTLSPPPLAHGNLSSNVAPNQQHSFYGESPAGDVSQGTEEPRDPFEGLDDNDIGVDALGDFTDFGDVDYKGSSNGSEKPQVDESQLDEEVSDLDLLELGDFINTEALSSDENDGQYEFDLVFDPQHQAGQQHQHQHQHQQQSQKQFRSPMVSPYLYRNRMSNRNAPIPAFRNRGSPYVANMAYPSDNFSPAPRRASRRSSSNGRRPVYGRDSYMSPGGYPKKKSKRRATSGTRSVLGQSGQQGQEGNGEHDFIGELIEIGAISPLFEIDQ